MRTRNIDYWTIDRWRTEPRFRIRDIDVNDAGDQNPPLWKDLTYAWLIVLVLWVLAAAVLV